MIYYISNKNNIKKKSNEIISIKIKEAVKLIENEKLICEDVETKTLNYRIKNPLLLIQIGTYKNQFIFDVSSGLDITPLKNLLSDRSIEKIVVNGYFERNMLRSVGITLNSMFDLALAAKVLRQGRDPRMIDIEGQQSYIYSLRGMYKEYLDINLNKEQQHTFINFKGTFTNEQILYAANDVKIFDLYEELVRRLIKNDLLCADYEIGKPVMELVQKNKYYVTVLEMKALEYFSDMLYNGIYLDKSKWTKLYETNKEKLRNKERKLNSHVVSNLKNYKYHLIEPIQEVKEMQTSLFGEPVKIKQKKKKNNRRINWNSSLQVRKIYNEFYKNLPLDKKGNESLDIKVLQKLSSYNVEPFLQLYVDYKKLGKLVDSYGIKYLSNICPITKRIHYQVNQVLSTGRVATSKPNLAQIPSTKEWRDCFTSSKKSFIVGADYSAQESRIMADKANDSVFIDFFQKGGGDSHSMIASKVFTVKEKREIIVTKNRLMVEYKGDISEEFLNKYKNKFPDATNVYYDDKYLIIEDNNPDISKRAQCPLRKKGKTINFFLSFGGSIYTLSIDQNISMEEAASLVNGFFHVFSGLDSYFKKEKEFAILKGFSITNKITRRKRFFPGWKEYRGYEIEKEKIKKELIEQFGKKNGISMYFKLIKDRSTELSRLNRWSYKIKGDIERAGMNNGIQGTAADMTKTSIILLQENLEKDGFDLISKIRPINFIHDENLLEVSNCEGLPEYAAKILKKSMEEASKIFLNKLVIPAEPYIGTCWEH